MKWKRGLLLAAIHLAVAGPLVAWLSADDARYARDHYIPHQPLFDAPSHTAENDGEIISFDSCRGMWVHYPPQTTIVRLANFPAFVLTGWRLECPTKWSLSGIFHVDSNRAPTPSSVAAQKRVDVGFILLIFLQWLLVGGLPLVRPVRWWCEPGIVITVGTVLSGLFVMMPSNGYDSLATGPVLLAWFAWLWWLGLLVWRAALAGRVLTSRRTASV
jgi:hypothetical protein